MLMVAWKWGPALAAGCTIVMKPAEQTPLTCLRMARLAQKAGIPDGVINVVPGYGPTAGAAIVKHPGVDKIAFTGSGETAQIIMRDAAPTLKRITFELGGKSPNIVFADADLDAAVAGAHFGLYFNQGQCCCAGSRLFVEEKVHDKFVDRLAAMNKGRKLGDPSRSGDRARPAGRSGPVRQDHALHRRWATRKGAKLLTGGKRFGDRGYYIEPTLFVDVKDEMAIARDEIFGPVHVGAEVQVDRRNRRPRQRHDLRPGRRRLDPRHRQGPRPGRQTPRRHRLDQLLRRLRRRRPLRRLQNVRPRPRAGRRGPEGVSGNEDGNRCPLERRPLRGLLCAYLHFHISGFALAPAVTNCLNSLVFEAF